MSEMVVSITLEIEDPAGTIHEVSVPGEANTQQFIDALVTRLNLPVIDTRGRGIAYRLTKTGSRRRLIPNISIADQNLAEGQLLRLQSSTGHLDQSHNARTLIARPQPTVQVNQPRYRRLTQAYIRAPRNIQQSQQRSLQERRREEASSLMGSALVLWFVGVIFFFASLVMGAAIFIYLIVGPILALGLIFFLAAVRK